MKSRRNERFRQAFAELPSDVKELAREAYRRFRDDPSHPGLQFKIVNHKHHMYSARVGNHYRALGVVQGDTIVWIWIGSHAEYDQLLRVVRRR